MAAVSGAIPNLIGGVSQQPAEIRSLNSSTALSNTWSDVATGLTTRPCGAYIGKVGPAPVGGNTVATHNVQKPSGNYEITVYAGVVRVFNLTTGLDETVTVEGGADSYVLTGDSARNIGFVTVGDTTFIYHRNRTVTATRTTEGTGATGNGDGGITRRNPNRHGTFWVKQSTGDDSSNYNLYVSNVLKASFSGSSVVANIKSGLHTDLVTAGYSVANLSTSVSSVIFDTEGEFLTATDDFADQALFAYNDSVTVFTDLPRF